MGNAILPKTYEYNENKLEFNANLSNSKNSVQNEDLGSSLMVESELQGNLLKLENRIEEIELTTLDNLKLLSNDIHTLFEMINTIDKSINKNN
jgi:hypothetical protein